MFLVYVYKMEVNDLQITGIKHALEYHCKSHDCHSSCWSSKINNAVYLIHFLANARYKGEGKKQQNNKELSYYLTNSNGFRFALSWYSRNWERERFHSG